MPTPFSPARVKRRSPQADSALSSPIPTWPRKSSGAGVTVWSRSISRRNTTRGWNGATCARQPLQCMTSCLMACCGRPNPSFFGHHLTALYTMTTFNRLAVLVLLPASLTAQRPDPLGSLVAEALRTNLSLTGERLAERRAAADVRDARGLFLPSLGVESRYSRVVGVPNL